MGDAVMNSLFSASGAEAHVTTDTIPAAALARWAALAGERACYAALPRQREAS